MTFLLLGIVLGVVLTGFLVLLYVRSTTSIFNEPEEAATLLQKASVLLHQIRVMALANFLAFIVLGTLSIISFTRLGDSNNAFTNLNRTTICDLYHQIDWKPPAALNCDGR